MDVTAHNSKFYYVYGAVYSPGRFPVTGGETVLDVINYVGGLMPDADSSKIHIMRSFPKGSPVQVLPVDYEEITMGTDASTNYQIMPTDRIVVPREWGESLGPASSGKGQSASPTSHTPEDAQLKIYFDRKSQDHPTVRGPAQRDVEHRLDEMEKKLDAILEKLAEPKKP